ncbi:MAG: c-type cytochrome [Proteobacteria bacterium]|nr:c-type cytochrome [Pseudomonadota bacterium]
MEQIFRQSRGERGARHMNPVIAMFAVAVALVAAPVAAQPLGGISSQWSDPDIWDIARGGQLYDDWMVVLEHPEPKGNHPAYPDIGKKKGKATWRCKECHGWDYMGEDGAYGKGGHYTGIKGLRRAVGMEIDELMNIIRDKTHQYTEAMIPDSAVRKLALFVSRGQVGMDQYIDRPSGRARGDLRRGASFFQTVCAICHGFDGATMVSRTATALAAFGDRGYLGTVADDNPWETLHKIRNGQPGVGMVALRVLSVQDQVDVLAYMQTLRRRRQ